MMPCAPSDHGLPPRHVGRPRRHLSDHCRPRSAALGLTVGPLDPNLGAVSYPKSLRDRLSKDEAYPIGRAALDPALSAAGVETLDMIYFLRAGIDGWREFGVGDVMGIAFKAATRDRDELTEVRIHAVPVTSKQIIRIALTRVVDDVVAWVRRAETSENVWRSTDHALVLRWDGNDLRIGER